MEESKHIEISDEMFGHSLVLFVGPREDYGKWMKENFDYDLADTVAKTGSHLVLETDGEQTAFLWLSGWEGGFEEWQSVAHEVNHHAFYVMEDVGVEDASEETFCYYSDYIRRKVLRALEKKDE